MREMGYQLPTEIVLAIIALLVIILIIWLMVPFAVFGIGNRVKEMDKRAAESHARIGEINESLIELNKNLQVLIQQNKIANFLANTIPEENSEQQSESDS